MASNTDQENSIYPLVAVDTVIFTVINQKLSVLLIQINSGHYDSKWAVPGGLVGLSENLDEAAVRVLSEKASLKDIYLEQVYTFGEIDRDVRGRSISVAYFALIDHPKNIEPNELEYYKDIEWFSIENLPSMAFDHEKIVRVAHERLKEKLGNTSIVYTLLPEEFTLTDMQRIYEIILEEKLDKRNFRKKIKAIDIVAPAGKIQEGVGHRPAELYRFKAKR